MLHPYSDFVRPPLDAHFVHGKRKGRRGRHYPGGGRWWHPATEGRSSCPEGLEAPTEWKPCWAWEPDEALASPLRGTSGSQPPHEHPRSLPPRTMTHVGGLSLDASASLRTKSTCVFFRFSLGGSKPQLLNRALGTAQQVRHDAAQGQPSLSSLQPNKSRLNSSDDFFTLCAALPLPVGSCPHRGSRQYWPRGCADRSRPGLPIMVATRRARDWLIRVHSTPAMYDLSYGGRTVTTRCGRCL